jgi:hypothetical protein
MNLPSHAGNSAAPATRWHKGPALAAALVLLVFLVIVIAGIFVPLYGDEVAVKFMRGMFIANGWKINTLVPQCNVDYLRSVPALFVPAALVYDFAYAHATPLGIRVGGMITALCWIALTGMTLHRLVRTRPLNWLMFAAVLAVAGLGVMPMTLVMARGETLLLLMLTLFVYLSAASPRRVASASRPELLGWVVLWCVLVSVFFYTHPKTLFFFPLLIIGAWLSFWRRSRILAMAMSGYILLTLWQSLQYTLAVTQCPNAPLYASSTLTVTTPLGLAFSAPLEFIKALLVNLHSAPAAVSATMAFGDTYQSGWLAPTPGVHALPVTSWTNAAMGWAVTVLFVIGAVLPPLVFALRLMRRQPIGTALWCSAGLWIGLLGHVSLYRSWNFYASALVLPPMAFMIALSLASPPQAQPVPKRHRAVIAVLISLYALFFISAGILLVKVMPATMHATLAGGIGMPGQEISVSDLNFAARRAQIRDFAKRCHIDGDGARHLVVDNLTFFAFDKLRAPLQSDYLNDNSFGVDYPGDAQLTLLRNAGARHVISQCGLLSSSLLRRATREDNLCCLDLDAAH